LRTTTKSFRPLRFERLPNGTGGGNNKLREPAKIAYSALRLFCPRSPKAARDI
jgi:hypothetical protein